VGGGKDILRKAAYQKALKRVKKSGLGTVQQADGGKKTRKKHTAYRRPLGSVSQGEESARRMAMSSRRGDKKKKL